MKQSCLRPQSEQVITVPFKAGVILIRYGGRWSMSWAWSTRRRDSPDQLVVLIVDTSKLYRPSGLLSFYVTSATLVKACPSIHACFKYAQLLTCLTSTRVLLWFDKLCKCTDLDERGEMPYRYLSYIIWFYLVTSVTPSMVKGLGWGRTGRRCFPELCKGFWQCGT